MYVVVILNTLELLILPIILSTPIGIEFIMGYNNSHHCLPKL